MPSEHGAKASDVEIGGINSGEFLAIENIGKHRRHNIGVPSTVRLFGVKAVLNVGTVERRGIKKVIPKLMSERNARSPQSKLSKECELLFLSHLHVLYKLANRAIFCSST